MNLEITKIVDAGVADEERLLLKVTAADNTGRYIVFDTVSVKPGTIKSRPKNIYWLPNREVKLGDLVVLYTKKGTNTQKENDDNTTTYFFYWGKESPLWNKPGDSAVLIGIENWKLKSLPR